MTTYCFDNFILKDIGKTQINNLDWDENQISVFRKIMFSFIDMVIIENYSKENAFCKMEKMFGLKEIYCEIWWKLVEQNEESLWKIMLVKRYNRIENKLEQIISSLEDD